MKTTLTLLSIGLFATLPLLPNALAQTEENKGTSRTSALEEFRLTKPHLGFLAGVASPEGSYGSTSELALEAGLQPIAPMSFAVELSRADLKPDNDKSTERTSLIGKAAYNFGGSTVVIRNSYAGFLLGAVFNGSDVDAVSGPILGFDIPLRADQFSAFSLGALAKYAVISGGTPDTLSIHGVLKYWY